MATLLNINLSTNISYYTLPIAFALALIPHLYAMALAGRRNFDNSHPREHADKVSSDPSLDPTTKGRIARARAAHINALETLGFHAAAVVAANQAGVPACELNALSVTYIASRALYGWVYVSLSGTPAGSWARSLVWAVGVGATVTLYCKAGYESMHEGVVAAGDVPVPPRLGLA